MFDLEFDLDEFVLEFGDSSICSEWSLALVEGEFLFLSLIAGNGERELCGGGVLRLMPPRFPMVVRVYRSRD